MAFSRKQKKAFLTAAVTAGVYLSFRYLLPLVFPFLAAYLMALFLRPSAAFLEKRLRISFRGRTIGIPIGVIGGVELILLCILLFVLLAAGGRRFMEELERFLEELPGRMEELSLLGGQFEQSAERFLHLPAGRSRKSCCRSSFKNRFRLRRGSCARLLWLFYFSLPRF